MATTTNYSWTTPDDTALVKDGAAAIRTLGSSADTTVKALNPGTTAGDIDYYTTSTAKARVGIGTAGQVLQVNSGATAPEWQTISTGGMTLLSTTTLSGTTTTISSISGAYNNLIIFVRGVTFNANAILRIRPNSVTANMQGWYFDTAAQSEIRARSSSTTYAGNAQSNYVLQIWNYTNTTSNKPCSFIGNVLDTNNMTQIHGTIDTASAITSLVISTVAGTSTFTAGTVEIYGVK